MNNTFRLIDRLLETQRECDYLKHDKEASRLRDHVQKAREEAQEFQKLLEAACADNFHLNQRLDELKAKLALYGTPEQA